MVKLAIIALHGIGTAGSTYYNKFEKRLHKSLTRKNITNEDYIFKGIHYSEVFHEEANKVTEMTKDLNWQKLRRFITHSLGDALAYQADVSGPNRIDFYQRVHDKINAGLQEISDRDDVPEDTPVLFLAHSMGAYIISNYIWDKQQQYPEGRSLLDRD